MWGVKGCRKKLFFLKIGDFSFRQWGEPGDFWQGEEEHDQDDDHNDDDDDNEDDDEDGGGGDDDNDNNDDNDDEDGSGEDDYNDDNDDGGGNNDEDDGDDGDLAINRVLAASAVFSSPVSVQLIQISIIYPSISSQVYLGISRLVLFQLKSTKNEFFEPSSWFIMDTPEPADTYLRQEDLQSKELGQKTISVWFL